MQVRKGQLLHDGGANFFLCSWKLGSFSSLLIFE